MLNGLPFLLLSSLFIALLLGDVGAAVDRDRLTCKCNPKFSNFNRSDASLVAVVEEKMQCCHGSTECDRYDLSVENRRLFASGGSNENGLFCFSDTSCIGLDDTDDGKCSSYDCYAEPFYLYSVKNSRGESSEYKCQPVRNLVNGSFCLLPTCDSFSTIFRKCKCDDQLSCICYGSDEAADPKLQEFAVFFTFADKYTLPEKKSDFLVVFLSCLGAALVLLVLLLVYRLGVCSRLWERTPNSETLPKPTGSSSTCSTLQRTDANQGLPSYDQVVRDSTSNPDVSAPRY